jgi:hypothetical protein
MKKGRPVERGDHCTGRLAHPEKAEDSGRASDYFLPRVNGVRA